MNTTSEKQGKPSRAAGAVSSPQNPKQADSWRETIESIVVAFVLAFLFRTFEAEAFVIPTGSMAPTLYGQHRDVTCTKCGTRFAVGVSSTPATDAEVRDGNIVPGYRSHFAICPNANCRYPNNVLEMEMFAGDRILVNKFPYEFKEPQRWDVVVFKFPESARTNYIKRLAGLPGEELKIEGGDIKVRPLGSSEPYRIARKTPEKQRRLQLLVHDNDHPARELLEAGWPESWDNAATTAWVADSEARTFKVAPDPADPGKPHWLRYSHYVPKSADWNQLRDGKSLDGRAKPQWIKDFYAYNGRIAVNEAAGAVSRGELPELFANDPEQWVGDLTLTCTVEVLAAEGDLTFELVKGSRRYHCRVDLATGRGQFAFIHEMDKDAEDPTDAGETFETGMNKLGRHSVSFSDVDDRLCLWVDDRLVKSLEFEVDSKFEPQHSPVDATERDTTPVGIAVRQAKVRVANLKVERDIYYRNEPGGGQMSQDRTFKLIDDTTDDDNDEFLMLGDNSPRSNDSRLWQSTHSVPRHLLIGKAFFVYWPHGVPFLNNGQGFPLGHYYEPPSRDGSEPNPPLPRYSSIPFYPQFGRMHRIR